MVSPSIVNVKVSKENDPNNFLINLNYDVSSGLEFAIDSEEAEEDQLREVGVELTRNALRQLSLKMAYLE
jgi:hypothetical protein